MKKKLIFLFVICMMFIPHIDAKEYDNEKLIIDNNIVIDNDIIEYSDLLQTLLDNDELQMLDVATNKTLLFDGFIRYRRNKKKDMLSSTSYNTYYVNILHFNYR